MPWAGILLAAVLAARVGGPPRGNTVLDPSYERFSFSAAAAARLGVLLGGGTEFVQPVGFGFAAQLYVHLLPLGSAPARLGFAFHGGHTRFLEQRTFLGEGGDGSPSVKRTTLLAHTDFTLGPSFQFVAGPLVLLVNGGAGVGIGQLVRPLSADPALDQEAVAAAFMLRGGAGIGIPIKNDHGVALGAGVQKFFSDVRRSTEPAGGPGTTPPTVVFDLLVETYLAYQAWF